MKQSASKPFGGVRIIQSVPSTTPNTHTEGEGGGVTSAFGAQWFTHSSTHNAFWWSAHVRARLGGYFGIFIYLENLSVCHFCDSLYHSSLSFISPDSLPVSFSLFCSPYISICVLLSPHHGSFHLMLHVMKEEPPDSQALYSPPVIDP